MKLTRAEIENLIPHRAPMLLVSEVTSWKAEEEIETAHTYTPDTIFFQGHFPGQPILPGIVLVESMAQSAAVLTSLSKNLTNQTATYLFMGMKDVKFFKPVTPDSTLTFKVKKQSEKMGVLSFSGEATHNGKTAATANFMAKLIRITGN